MSYRQTDDEVLDGWLDELDDDAVQVAKESVDNELELVKRALDSAELSYALQSRENDGENDEMMNHLREVRGHLIAYLRTQED